MSRSGSILLFTVLLVPLLGLLQSCSEEDYATCPPPCQPKGWIIQQTPTTEDLGNLHVFDRDHAIAVGTAGTIVRTADGGDTWTVVDAGTTALLRDVFFLDDSHGWIVGDNGTALASTDGGWTWEAFAVPATTHLREVVFTDAQTGFIGGGPTGGADGDPLLLKTLDGGINWSPSVFPFTIRTMFFADANTGFAGGGDQLLRTLDGGATWGPSPHGHTGWLSCVYFADNTNGWVSGGSGFMGRTTDGGVSWETQNSGTTRNIVEHFALDPDRCWYVARSPGVIGATTDGGQQWRFQTLPGEGIPSDVAFADSLTGWVSGLDGLILKTTTGGW